LTSGGFRISSPIHLFTVVVCWFILSVREESAIDTLVYGVKRFGFCLRRVALCGDFVLLCGLAVGGFCRAMIYASAAYVVMRCLSICLCVCPSVCVCLSVCLSRSWILSRRINISSKCFYRRVSKPVFIACQHTDARYWYLFCTSCTTLIIIIIAILSVCSSDCPKRSSIRWKLLNILSQFFHRT